MWLVVGYLDKKGVPQGPGLGATISLVRILAVLNMESERNFDDHLNILIQTNDASQGSGLGPTVFLVLSFGQLQCLS